MARQEKGIEVKFKKTVAGTQVTGKGTLTVPAEPTDKTIHVKVTQSSRPDLVPVNSYVEAQRNN